MDGTPIPTPELPQYKCHKTVGALKIKNIEKDPNGGAVLFFEDQEGLSVDKNKEWIEKHSPEVGGYLVRYEGGYESFSPAKAFEDGYTKID